MKYKRMWIYFALYLVVLSFSDALTLSKKDALLQIVNNGIYIGNVRLKCTLMCTLMKKGN